MKQIYDFVFVVLVYRNTNDLIDFFSTFHVANSAVVVVNSYYDDKSKADFERIALSNGAHFINVENRGYGYGNNVGVSYALNNYSFKYLIISNADIEIQQLTIEDLGNTEGIIAPDIRTLTNKRQNPFYPFRTTFLHHLVYNAYKYDLRWLLLIGICINKILRILFYLFRNGGIIYASHGAFVIFSFASLVKLAPIYNEDMFLFGEECHLALKANKLTIKTTYKPSIKIKHKEDGSTYLLGNQYKYTKESFMRFYEYWYKSRRI